MISFVKPLHHATVRLVVMVICLGIQSLASEAQSVSTNFSDADQILVANLVFNDQIPQINSGPETTATLESFERLALEQHPSLRAAAAKSQVARHEALQAGLYPNPQLGMFIDELGNENDPGMWGAYLQRTVVRGNKLGLKRDVKNREATVWDLAYGKSIIRLETNVRLAFYKLLIVQQKLQLASQIYQAQQSVVDKSRALTESGETPKTDFLQAELQAQKTMILFRQAEVAKLNAWRELAATVGNPDLPIQEITGSLDASTEPITFETSLANILANNPEMQMAEAEVDRIRASIQKEIAQTIPDYQTQFRLGRDSATNHFYAGVQLQVPLLICDRNQGNISAAKSRLVQAQNNVERVKLDLAKRLATEFQRYESALLGTELFATELLPKAGETLTLLKTGYPEEVSILQLLIAQQTVIDLTSNYLDSLDQLWISRLKIQGLMLNLTP